MKPMKTKDAYLAWSINAAILLAAAAISGSLFVTGLCAVCAYAAGRCKSDMQPNYVLDPVSDNVSIANHE